MSKKKSLKSVLLEDCSFIRSSLKYVPEGGEMLKYIGCDMFLIKLTRNDENSPWNVSQKVVKLTSISDWEPLSGTYKAEYLDMEDGNTLKSMRMIPEGFQLEDSEKTNNMERFVPMSIHATLNEMTIFYDRLAKLFEERESLSVESLKKIQESKQEEQLGYYHNVGLVIKNPEVGICYFRIYKMTPIVKFGKEYKFSVQDKEGNIFPLKIKGQKNEFYLNGESLGEFKIFDIV